MSFHAVDLFGRQDHRTWDVGVDVYLPTGLWPPDPNAVWCQITERGFVAGTPIGPASTANWVGSVVLLRAEGGDSLHDSNIVDGLLAPAPLGNGPGDVYLGVRIAQFLQPDRYGWIHAANSASNPFDICIVDWAYETTGASILAGAIPAPGSVLTACAATFLAFQRRRVAIPPSSSPRCSRVFGHGFTND